MFDNLLFAFLNNVMFKNIDSQPRMVEPKPINDRWIEFKLTQTATMFDNLLFAFLNNVMFKNIDSQPRMVEPKPARPIPDILLQKFGLARTQSLKCFIRF